MIVLGCCWPLWEDLARSPSRMWHSTPQILQKCRSIEKHVCIASLLEPDKGRNTYKVSKTLQANALKFVARCEWIYDNDLALTYTKGAKEKKWGTNCKDPVGKVMKGVKDCIAVQNLKDLSSNLWTKRTAASTSGFSPFSPRWCWWSLWADNWNESRADFNIAAWKF